MERGVKKRINAEICDSHQVVDLTLILNLVALVFSMILCYLLFQAI
jgi:hypothetical protein